MVKRFGIVKTLNERLSRDSISIDTNNNHQEESEEPPGGGILGSSSKIIHQNEYLSEKVVFLTEQLVDCRSCLLKTQKDLESLHYIKEQQFKSVVGQLLSFESGLRRKQRELCLAISQRDRVIREQSHIIRFLAGKSGLEGASGNIQELRNEALSKIPVLHEEGRQEERRRRSGREDEEENDSCHSSKKLSCIIETGSEHDSDSAIILDDSSGSPSSAKRISRSVSDVVVTKEEEEDNEDEEELHLLEGSLDSLLHTKQLLSSPQKRVTKPRDLKNKSHLKKSSDLSNAPLTPPSFLCHQQHNTTKISRDNETGSVICSIFNTDENDNESVGDMDGNVPNTPFTAAATTSSFA
ncbi:unnamed protein product [Lepeophtheirus salmonis]|uniref:(salmon louse) hypothetical protein n=1 Tax=Lepeophtheirus salmonis TaxID=72036 RepID=A0A7R8D9D7_LEPSM|nr:unnamed protein product [Lepeophtheirus salmonis]CAF3044558.1 unnamed protein product [Lepeophtheirus salmonis]